MLCADLIRISGYYLRIFDPADPGTTTDDMFYLVDPNTGSYATAGVRDALKNITHQFDESKHYFYPIPEKELQLNEKLKQNPNW